MTLLSNVAASSPWAGWALLGTAFLLAATGTFALLRHRGSRAARTRVAPSPMTCPTCRRGYAAGAQYCPVDATRLVESAEGGAARAAAARGGKCPRCRRAFEAGMRFCPMDAEELVPLTMWQATHAEGGVHVESYADHLIGGQGKICPVCAGKYDLEAVFCGRDASELVTVN